MSNTDSINGLNGLAARHAAALKRPRDPSLDSKELVRCMREACDIGDELVAKLEEDFAKKGRVLDGLRQTEMELGRKLTAREIAENEFDAATLLLRDALRAQNASLKNFLLVDRLVAQQ